MDDVVLTEINDEKQINASTFQDHDHNNIILEHEAIESAPPPMSSNMIEPEKSVSLVLLEEENTVKSVSCWKSIGCMHRLILIAILCLFIVLCILYILETDTHIIRFVIGALVSLIAIPIAFVFVSLFRNAIHYFFTFREDIRYYTDRASRFGINAIIISEWLILWSIMLKNDNDDYQVIFRILLALLVANCLYMTAVICTSVMAFRVYLSEYLPRLHGSIRRQRIVKINERTWDAAAAATLLKQFSQHQMKVGSSGRVGSAAMFEKLAGFFKKLAVSKSAEKRRTLFAMEEYSNKHTNVAKEIFIGLCIASNKRSVQSESLDHDDFTAVFSGKHRETWGKKSLELFDVDSNGAVTLQEIDMKLGQIVNDRQSLIATLDDVQDIVIHLQNTMYTIISVFIIFIVLLIFGIRLSNFFVSSTSIILLTFMFLGVLIKKMIDSVSFLLMQHPYDVGDVIMLDNERHRVLRINLLTTTFKVTSTGALKIIPNEFLASKPIENLRRSGPMIQTIILLLDCNRITVLQLKELKDKVVQYLNSEFALLVLPKTQVRLRSLEKANGSRLEIGVRVFHRTSFQEISGKVQVKEALNNYLLNLIQSWDSSLFPTHMVITNDEEYLQKKIDKID